MASIVERPKKDGDSTFQVKWREAGEWETERFGDEDSAEQFKKLVEAHGGKWPHGWVRGKGFVEPDTDPDDMPLIDWARRYATRLTGVDKRTKDDYLREVEQHIALIVHTKRSGEVQAATIGNLTADDVQDWVRLEEDGARDEEDPKKWARRPASPKSIANRHGLLWCIVEAAINAEPQLRTKNCCTGTSLPRTDDEVAEEMVFLEREEYQRVATEITDPAARDLADWLVGTGMRWGEASALQVQDLKLTSGTPTATVSRAWKRSPKGSDRSFFLGPPKTRKARRVVALSPMQAATARRLVKGQRPEAYVFRTAQGKAWMHANFFSRKWKPAVTAAVEKGLPRRPRIHDLRHTHVAWLIAANIPLPAIQNRLGHESIQTTVDRYGHLVRSLDGEMTAAVEAAMSVPEQRAGLSVVRGG
ncbi:site-specific integrase [Streptomyces sp. N2-109]|uniref:Site-specific integrase n=1 Tax=Streptomyces gossypii TaxID=2883101 RepID=A0ABT2JT99_9ACTN|nr:site-specific integrase [Streptomyces gossypii]MCT2591083.1 site-specific integrase [Streptomyces gossypii]